MSEDRIHNFNAGPAALPLPVLEEIRDSFLNLNNCGMSVTEISHRSKWFDDIINDAVARTKRLLKLDDRFHVLFIQGGASMQFAMIPMNFLSDGKTADYVNTGTWSTKAIKEAEAYDGPSIIIAYAPCINHGIDMSLAQKEQKKAVDAGYWTLYRFNPALKEEGKNPFILDSKEPTIDVKEFLAGEKRYTSLKTTFPDKVDAYWKQFESFAKERYEFYKRLAEI